ncbi:MAG: EAL domain-containing protein [Gammaproteobacteria bacterium]|nr:EAL domain-containing protein [Gammaproteobacteria bacterium]
MQFDFRNYSLRALSLFFAVIAGILVLSIAWLSQQYLVKENLSSSENVQTRNTILSLNSDTKDLLWEGKVSLDGFLLTAEPQSHNRVLLNLSLVKIHLKKMLELTESSRLRHHSLINQTLSRLDELNGSIKQLMTIRSTANQQYPAFEVMSKEMEPSNVLFAQLSSMLIENIDVDSGQSEVTSLVHSVRYNWLSMTSSFRLYLNMLFGAISSEALQGRAENVLLYYEQVIKDLTALRQMDESGDLGLMEENIPARLLVSANQWMTGFEKVINIRQSGKWRSDYPLLVNNIEPSFIDIWRQLALLDDQINNSAVEDMNSMFRVANNISLILWASAVLFFAVLLVGHLYFNRSVLRPISIVGYALEKEGESVEGEIKMTSPIKEIKLLIDSFTKMRDEVRARQEALIYQAGHDPLTGLSNRHIFRQEIDRTLQRAKENHSSFAVLIKDLDSFKEINDALGHHAGDDILVQVTERLLNCMGENDTIARLGGDEFAIILPDAGREEAALMATQISNVLDHDFHYQTHALSVRGSIGIAMFPDDSEKSTNLLQFADVAMYSAKRNNQNFSFYNQDDDENSLQNLELLSELRHAIEHNELLLHYQPKMEIDSGTVLGVEALLRWNHSIKGMIAPGFLVELAERSGIIGLLTLWIIRESLRQRKCWLERGIDLCISVNLSVWNIQDKDFEGQIKAIIDDIGWDGEGLIFEITEGAMMTDPERALTTMNALTELGIHFSVDDYGTGFSSLAYLKRLPVNEMKIDQSFVMDMLSNDADQVIVRSTVELAHNLGMRVVAEGIEDGQTLERLKSYGCDIGQGYFIKRPATAADLEKWLQERN